MIVPATVADYAGLINSGTLYAQANYGDGEWSSILGREGQNGQNEDYLPSICMALRMTLDKPHPYYYGTNPGKKLEAEVAMSRWGQAPVQWVDKEILSSANVNGLLYPFLSAVRQHDILLVGPAHLRGLDEAGVLPPHRFVEVPFPNAWLQVNRIEREIRLFLRDSSVDMVLLCSGMSTKVLIWRTFPDFKDRCWFIDMGAIFDPYMGVFSRKGYRKPNTLAMMHRNKTGVDP